MKKRHSPTNEPAESNKRPQLERVLARKRLKQKHASAPAAAQPDSKSPSGGLDGKAPRPATSRTETEAAVRSLIAKLGTLPPEVELSIALKKFLARMKLERIISDLQKAADEAQGTSEAADAEAAIQLLRGAPATANGTSNTAPPQSEAPEGDSV